MFHCIDLIYCFWSETVNFKAILVLSFKVSTLDKHFYKKKFFPLNENGGSTANTHFNLQCMLLKEFTHCLCELKP